MPHADIWEGYLNHPFVHGIADGSLDIQKFRFIFCRIMFIYLITQRYSRRALSSPGDPEIMRVFATSVANILGGEMNIHRGYMGRLGITEEDAERVKPSLNNESYTSYMRAVAAEEGPAEIMAAVLSCALSYEYIAKWIVDNYPNADQHEFYGEWVQGYASEDYAAENRKLVAYMERLSEGYTEPQLARLTDIFVAARAMRACSGTWPGTRRCKPCWSFATSFFSTTVRILTS